MIFQTGIMKRYIYIIFLCLTAFNCFALIDMEKQLRRVEKKRSGEVIINYIPNIKAQRDYCVPASVEMILRYYGARIKQKKLGKLFVSSHHGGTNSANMMRGFEDKDLQDFECKMLYAISTAELQRLLDAYSRHPELPHAAARKLRHGMKKHKFVFDLLDLKIAGKVSPEARPELYKKFPEILKSLIDNGYPLLWSVAMNLDPHDRTTGGHMRVICGYKMDGEKITEVIFLDPWGSKRKFKRVTFDVAAAMTTQIAVIIPRNR